MLIDLDEIERRIPSHATECAYCHRLATLVCPVCGTMVCEDHRILAARDAIGTDCEGVAMIPAQHDTATMDRVALVAEVRRLRAESEERLRTIHRVAEALDAEPPQDIAQQVRWIVAEVRRLRAELATAREIVEGRIVPPTPDEIDAHESRGGSWLVQYHRVGWGSDDEALFVDAFDAAEAESLRLGVDGLRAVRWVAVLDGRPCAWPVVTTVAATLDAGPRDGDGREVTT